MQEYGVGARSIDHVGAGAAHRGVALRPSALEGAVTGCMLWRVEADLALLGVAALHTVRVPVGRLQQGGGTHVTCSRTSKTWRPGFQMGKKKIVCGGERQEFV